MSKIHNSKSLNMVQFQDVPMGCLVLSKLLLSVNLLIQLKTKLLNMHDESAKWNENWVEGKLRFAKFKDALISVCHTPFSRTEASFVRLRPQNPRIHGQAVPSDFPLIAGKYFD